MVLTSFHEQGWYMAVLEGSRWMGLGLSYDETGDPFDINYHAGVQFRRGHHHTSEMNVTRDFVIAYKHLPTFLHVHLAEYSHNSLNYVKNLDTQLSWMFTEMSEAKALDDTFFLFMSDHGYRFGGFPKTEQGIIENNMPMMLMIPPTTLAKEHPELLTNLRKNSLLLTSHFDINRMLRQLVSLGSGKNESLLFPKSPVLGHSLLSPLPQRSCSEADIPLDFCSCPSGQVKVSPETVEEVVKAVLEDINTFILPLWGCHTFARGSSH